MTKVQWRVAFKGQQFAIGDCSLASLRALAKGVREGGLLRLLADPVALYILVRGWISLLVLQKNI
jgi:hypothetical protein